MATKTLGDFEISYESGMKEKVEMTRNMSRTQDKRTSCHQSVSQYVSSKIKLTFFCTSDHLIGGCCGETLSVDEFEGSAKGFVANGFEESPIALLLSSLSNNAADTACHQYSSVLSQPPCLYPYLFGMVVRT